MYGQIRRYFGILPLDHKFFTASLFVSINILTLLEGAVAASPKFETNGTIVCKTQGCINSASHVLELMNESIHPCHNFYNFACGNFVRKTKIPNDQLLVRTFSAVQSKVQDQLRLMLAEQIDQNELKSFEMAKKLYKSCMNEVMIKARGLYPLNQIVEDLGGWPVVKGAEWDGESKWDWTKTVKEFRDIGFPNSQILKMSVSPNAEESTTQIISIFPLTTSLTNMVHMNNETQFKFVDKYHDYMVEIAEIFGAKRQQAEKELMESLKFEIELAKNAVYRSSGLPSKQFKLQELQWKYPFIQWVNYINALLPSPTSVNESELVILRSPSYFDRLGRLLDETPRRVIANYLIWKIIAHSTYYLTNDLRRRQFAIEAQLTGVQPQKLRWKECTNILNERMPACVGAMYVRKYFHSDTKAAVLDMVNRIRDEFELILKEVTWMDEKTRRIAVAKLKAMTAHIGYPNELMDNQAIEKYHKNLEIDENDYLTSILKLNKFNTGHDFSFLHKPVNKSDWRVDPHAHAATVNGFNSRFENSIQFPAGILQGQFFSTERPQYMNFGAIGSIIGHEITHGLDDRGSLVGINGEFHNWWQYETGLRFIDKIKCIVEQYENYVEPITGLKLNGTQTQSENIADNAGVKEAYRAYQKWTHDNGPEPNLPGLNYTPQQMFWIAAAQIWCSKRRPESMRGLVSFNEHAPDQFRVIGSFSNRIEFANDFNCPKGSPMNPARKCDVW